MKRILVLLALALLAAPADIARAAAPELRPVYIVPNFHPASCGWLTNWSLERNYCANSYLNHLDRVGTDPNYAFAISECNNMIAIRNFQPARFEELKRRVIEGRVEPVNAFFLEPTICLSGGEALVKMGVEGLRWQQAFLGVRPRFCWAIDVCGAHAQMPQICCGLGLEALVMTRPNTTGKTIFWYESADGTRVLTLMPGHYSDFGPVFATTGTLTQKDLLGLQKNLEGKAKNTPAGAPLLVLGGNRDYALAPANQANPTAFLEQWKTFAPGTPLRFATLSQYFDALPRKMDLPVMRGDGGYFFNSFWIQNPRVKTWYRKDEHALQAAEALATIASIAPAGAGAKWNYPVQDLYHAWLLMCLNMDRNTLWGAAGGMVFQHPDSWDALDRFEWVDKTSRAVSESAGHALLGEGSGIGLFNAANWTRRDPQALALPAGKSLAGMPCERLEDGRVLCQPELPAVGLAGFKLAEAAPEAPKPIALPETIENKYYVAKVDRATGDLVSLKVKPSLSEVLGGPANVVVAEKGVYKGDPGDHAQDRTQRPRLKSTKDFKQSVTAREGPLAFTVEVAGDFLGGPCRRTMRFYKDSPRIDFETELNDVPDRTIVVAEFPLAESPLEIRRGVPYGFSRGAWAKPNPGLPGWTKGIVPAVRWSDYALADGAGLAILDRGLSGREIEDKTPIVYLLNASDKYYGYPNAWLSGKGKHRLEYAVVAHEGAWRVPQAAWEYNGPAVAVAGAAERAPQSFIQTSENLVLEAVRREGAQVELRMAECLGEGGPAWVRVELLHYQGTLTDMTGQRAAPLTAERDGAGARYRFPVRPQQIVTMRLTAPEPVAEIQPLADWEELVPPAKRAALNQYVPELKGHPPRGN